MRFVLLLMVASMAFGLPMTLSDNPDLSVGNVIGPIVQISPGLYQWNYEIGISDKMQFDDQTAFTLFDLLGFSVANLAAELTTPSGWVGTAQGLGIYPHGAMLADSPTIANVTWTRTNATPLAGNTATFGFSITSTLAWHQTVGWRAYATPLPNSGARASAFGTVEVPAAIPEPSTLWLVALPLVYLAYHRRSVRPIARAIR